MKSLKLVLVPWCIFVGFMIWRSWHRFCLFLLNSLWFLFFAQYLFNAYLAFLFLFICFGLVTQYLFPDISFRSADLYWGLIEFVVFSFNLGILRRKYLLKTSHNIFLCLISNLSCFFDDLFTLFSFEYIPPSSFQSYLSKLLCPLEIFSFIFLSNSHKFKSIFYTIPFDQIIKRSLSLKWRSMINLNNNRFCIISEHNIKT